MSESKRKHERRAVHKEIRVRATPEELWEAWAKPDRIAQWFVDSAVGDMETDEVVQWKWDAFDFDLPIEVYEVERGRYLAFGGVTGAEEGQRLNALQEVVIVQEGGSCLLRLVNSGFREGAEWDDEYEGVDSGWEMALALLKHWLEEHRGETRVHSLAVRPAAFEYADLLPLYTTSKGLTSWLADRAELSTPELELGTRCRLELTGGETMTGRVITRTSRELQLTWDERRAVVGLKCFAMGPTRAVAIDLHAWGLAEGELEPARALLEAALDRLLPRIPAPARAGS